MFGSQGGESADTVARKKGYMHDAHQRWSFVTNFDLSTIKNEVQLSSWSRIALASPRSRPRARLRSGCEARSSDQRHRFVIQ
jgi:hypothetical protein